MFFVNFHQTICTFYSFGNWSFAIININGFNRHYIFIIFSFIMHINSKYIWSHSILIYVLHILRHNYIYFYKNKKSTSFKTVLFNHVKSFMKKNAKYLCELYKHYEHMWSSQNSTFFFVKNHMIFHWWKSHARIYAIIFCKYDIQVLNFFLWLICWQLFVFRQSWCLSNLLVGRVAIGSDRKQFFTSVPTEVLKNKNRSDEKNGKLNPIRSALTQLG